VPANVRVVDRTERQRLHVRRPHAFAWSRAVPVVAAGATTTASNANGMTIDVRIRARLFAASAACRSWCCRWSAPSSSSAPRIARWPACSSAWPPSVCASSCAASGLRDCTRRLGPDARPRAHRRRAVAHVPDDGRRAQLLARLRPSALTTLDQRAGGRACRAGICGDGPLLACTPRLTGVPDRAVSGTGRGDLAAAPRAATRSARRCGRGRCRPPPCRSPCGASP